MGLNVDFQGNKGEVRGIKGKLGVVRGEFRGECVQAGRWDESHVIGHLNFIYKNENARENRQKREKTEEKYKVRFAMIFKEKVLLIYYCHI